MADEKLDWFPCNPAKLLGALAGMRAPEGYVYTIVLMRIYEDGGECRDTLDALSTRTRLNKRVVAEALSSLFRSGRLASTGIGITNPVASDVIAESHALREKRKSAGTEGANQRWKKDKQKQQNGDGKRIANAQRSHTPLQVQDTLFPSGNRAMELDSVVMKDPPLDAEADYYRRGREVLGANAGGVLTKLIRAKGGNLSLARSAIEHASTRGDAREYVGAMVRNNGGSSEAARNDRPGSLAVVGAKLRRTIEERRRDQNAYGAPSTVEAADHGSDRGYRNSPEDLVFVDRSRSG